MPESNRPLVERIARVLAGAALSSNAEGSDPSAGRQGRPGLAGAYQPGAGRAAHHARARRSDGRGRRCRNVARMVEAAIAQRVEPSNRKPS